MGFPRFYRAVLGLIRASLLTTSTARAIARKGLPGILAALIPTAAPRLLAQWSGLDPWGKEEGFLLTYLEGFGFFPFPVLEAGQPFIPGGSRVHQRYVDSRGIGEVRMVLNVLEAGPLDSILRVQVTNGAFVGSVPECPLDATGEHVTAWEEVLLPPEPVPEDSALFSFFVSQDSPGAGTARVGVIQLQVR